jgi:predicted small secreted protein
MKTRHFLLGLVSLIVATSLLSACNTVQGTASGFGQDVQATSHAVANTF